MYQKWIFIALSCLLNNVLFSMYNPLSNCRPEREKNNLVCNRRYWRSSTTKILKICLLAHSHTNDNTTNAEMLFYYSFTEWCVVHILNSVRYSPFSLFLCYFVETTPNTTRTLALWWLSWLLPRTRSEIFDRTYFSSTSFFWRVRRLNFIWISRSSHLWILIGCTACLHFWTRWQALYKHLKTQLRLKDRLT